MRIDMHIHSNISDGDRPVAEIIDIAFRKKLDAIAITDHDTLEHLKYIPRNPKVKVIAGIEISTIDKNTGIRADVLGYGFRKPDLIEKLTLPILQHKIDYVDVRDAVYTVKKAGGYAVLAHPGRQKNFYMTELAPFDGIEYNHPSNSENDKVIIKVYARKFNLFLTGGSDFHGIYNEIKVEIGDYLMPYAENRDAEFLLRTS